MMEIFLTLLRKQAVVDLSDIGSQDIKLQYGNACNAGRTFFFTRVKKYVAVYRRSVYSAPQSSSFTYAEYVGFIPRDLKLQLQECGIIVRLLTVI